MANTHTTKQLESGFINLTIMVENRRPVYKDRLLFSYGKDRQYDSRKQIVSKNIASSNPRSGIKILYTWSLRSLTAGYLTTRDNKIVKQKGSVIPELKRS